MSDCQWTERKEAEATTYQETVCPGRSSGGAVPWTDEDDLQGKGQGQARSHGMWLEFKGHRVVIMLCCFCEFQQHNILNSYFHVFKMLSLEKNEKKSYKFNIRLGRAFLVKHSINFWEALCLSFFVCLFFRSINLWKEKVSFLNAVLRQALCFTGIALYNIFCCV